VYDNRVRSGDGTNRGPTNSTAAKAISAQIAHFGMPDFSPSLDGRNLSRENFGRRDGGGGGGGGRFAMGSC
jgi:hypothetical protein